MKEDQILSIEIVREPKAGEGFRKLFQQRWLAYQRWMKRAEAVSHAKCVDALRTHMPELVPLFEQLHALIGGGDEEARFLSLYCPPRLVRACSQVVLDTPDGPILLRSYDFAPHLFDGIVLDSRWASASSIAVTDCLWGALDGVNNHGLAIALAFGGRKAIGPGFAAPLVVRYVLETCATVRDASRALQRVPVAMPYTFVVADAAGEFMTAFLAPDRPAELRKVRASTNHQSDSNWTAYQRFSGSVERLNCLAQLLDRDADPDEIRQAFLRPPLWRTRYAQGAGTLYVAEYRLAERTLHLHWPDQTEQIAMNDSSDRSFSVSLPSFNCSPLA